MRLHRLRAAICRCYGVKDEWARDIIIAARRADSHEALVEAASFAAEVLEMDEFRALGPAGLNAAKLLRRALAQATGDDR